MRKKTKPDQSIEIAAQKYRDAVLGNGDIDETDRLLDEIIRPPCQRLMRSYGVLWDPVLEQFLHCVLLAYSLDRREQFLAFFLRNLKNNFTLPEKARPDYSGTGLRTFQERWESHPERHSISRVDNELRRKRRAEERAAAAADPAEQQD